VVKRIAAARVPVTSKSERRSSSSPTAAAAVKPRSGRLTRAKERGRVGSPALVARRSSGQLKDNKLAAR
jgi:hypothetical protein